MDLEGSARAFREVIAGAGARDDLRLMTHGRLGLSLMRFFAEPDHGALDMLADVESAAEAFASLDDPTRTCAHPRLEVVRVRPPGEVCRVGAGGASRARPRRQPRRGPLRRGADLVPGLGGGQWTNDASVRGSRPARRSSLRPRDDPAVIGHALYSLSTLQALDGRFADARESADRGLASFDGLGMAFSAWHPLHRGSIDLLAGDDVAALGHLRTAVDLLAPLNDLPSASNAASLLADLLLDLDRLEGIDELLADAQRWAPKDQPLQAARWRAACARLRARRHEPDAEELAREAVELALQTDHLIRQGDAFVALADVLRRAGQDAAPDDRRSDGSLCPQGERGGRRARQATAQACLTVRARLLYSLPSRRHRAGR